MKNVEFYLNGRNVEGGKILSYSITNEMAFKVVELVNRIGESQDIIAKINTMLAKMVNVYTMF